jgi:hypothetical protein
MSHATSLAVGLVRAAALGMSLAALGLGPIPRARAGDEPEAGWPPARLVPRVEFLERSGIHYNFPPRGPARDERLIFEAQAAPHFYFANQLALSERPGVTRSWFQAVSLTFNLRLRMVADRSAPVRPPSYMPRLDYQLFHLWRPSGTAPGVLQLLELRAAVGHQSNGQQYCPFLRSAPPPGTLAEAPPCEAPPRGAVPNNRVNYRSGDFATNFVILGTHLARLWLDEDRYEARRVSGGILLEANPLGMDPGGISRSQYDLYGPFRIRLEAEAQWHQERPFGVGDLAGTSAVGASAELMSRTGSGIPNDREIVEASHVLDGMGGFGIFVRLVTGQDYMNVLYAAGRVNMFQVGVTWEVSPRMHYCFSPANEPLGGRPCL